MTKYKTKKKKDFENLYIGGNLYETDKLNLEKLVKDICEIKPDIKATTVAMLLFKYVLADEKYLKKFLKFLNKTLV